MFQPFTGGASWSFSSGSADDYLPLRRGWRTWRREAVEIKITYTYIIVIALILLSGVLAYDAFTSYISRYLTVSQVVENSAAYSNEEEIRVIGTVVNGSTRWKDGSLEGFDLTDGEYVINVTYTRGLPPGFNDAEQVVVIGRLISPGIIEGYDMLVKCPSKYEGGEKSLLTDPVFLGAILLGAGAIVGTVVSMAWKRKQQEA